MQRIPVLALAAATLSAACSTPFTPPTDSHARVAQQSSPARSIRTYDDALAEVAARQPAFAGLWFADGRLHVAMTDLAPGSAAARSAITAVFADPRLGTAPIVLDQVPYSFQKLAAWSANLPAAFSIPGVVSTNIDEVRDKLAVGVTSASAGVKVAAYLENFGVPAGAIRTFEREPAVLTSSSLGGEVREIIGGVHMDLPATGSWCTLGFNVEIDGEPAFATNGHCSNEWGTSGDGTDYWQAFRTVQSDYVGAEGVESQIFTNSTDSRCPDTEYYCKWSDFSTGTYTDSMASQQAMGYFARPTTRTRFDSNLVIDSLNPALAITNKVLFPVVGDTVDKIGARTGWTYGPVTSSCVTEFVSNGVQAYYFICSDEAAMGVNHGDSGSGVFVYGAVGDTASLAGQMFAGYNSNGHLLTVTIFSPLNNIQSEFGLIPATIYGN
ncbi:MAG TPA: hypothetical protein VIJ16_06205 [Gemmatimonadaceae bacterium]